MANSNAANGPRRRSASIESGAAEEPLRPGTSVSAPSRPRIAIGEALTNGWFEAWYQPKINLKRRCLAGAETLACIRHPGLGMLMPGDFECGAGDNVAGLSEHALVAALENWSLFDQAGFNLSLAMNVPVVVLLDLPVRDLVAEHRPRSDRWPGIILHVTEDEIVRNAKLAREITTRLRVSRIKLAIDNFGAGYSSLASLREIPFVEIRLDRGFVLDCATDPTNGAICQTAIDLSHRFGGAAAADGIKSQADLQALMAMGCDFGQGELIAPPMSQQQFLALLRERVTKPRPPADGGPPAAATINRIA
jgi:EAL domain-containing protein (putative c-di-GMP-specific phosphodiesterase class I)